jgi:uncharacterized protein YjbJ (UPF0337 family)
VKKDEVTGTAQELKGKVEKEFGKATGNKSTQAKAEDVRTDAKEKIHRATE